MNVYTKKLEKEGVTDFVYTMYIQFLAKNYGLSDLYIQCIYSVTK